jgi:hypothetical protein
MKRSFAAAALLVAVSAALAAAKDAPPPLLDVARAHGEKSVFRVYCKANGRYVATMKVDLNNATINDQPYRVEGNTLRWNGRNAPPPGQPAQERSMEIEGLRYTGPTLGGPVGSYDCEPSKERPAGLIFAP